MRKKEKQILLKDLCARLPYNFWVRYKDKDYLVTGYGHGRVSLLPSIFSSATGPCPLIEEVKPYLRLMSSMTEEEKKKFDKFICIDILAWEGDTEIGYENQSHIMAGGIDWLLAHHFDYHDLIKKGLAIEAPEDMYKEN